MEHINVTDCETALNRLMAGNKEYLIAKEGKGNISEEIRILTHEYGQKPYAIVIACSDSRVIPEKIFMVGIGEIFTPPFTMPAMIPSYISLMKSAGLSARKPTRSAAKK